MVHHARQLSCLPCDAFCFPEKYVFHPRFGFHTHRLPTAPSQGTPRPLLSSTATVECITSGLQFLKHRLSVCLFVYHFFSILTRSHPPYQGEQQHLSNPCFSYLQSSSSWWVVVNKVRFPKGHLRLALF